MGFYTLGNVTLARSRVNLRQDGLNAAANARRPLQGQSPWITNLQFGYQSLDSGFDFLASFLMFGRRVREGAVPNQEGAPVFDVYELPRPQLDAKISYAFESGFKVALSGRNLLNPKVIWKTGEVTTRGYRTGSSIGLSASYSY